MVSPPKKNRGALRSWALVGGFFLSFSLAHDAHAVALRNDQTKPACSKRELKHWKKDLEALTDSDRAWMELWSHQEKTLDMTGDGIPESLEIIATQYVRVCDVAEILPYKEVVIKIKNGATGQTQLISWRGGLPDRYTWDAKTHTLTIYGRSYDGTRWEKPIAYP